MQIYAANEQFEKAAKMRDSYLDLQKTLERQKVVYENTKLNEDIINDITSKLETLSDKENFENFK